MLPRIAVLGGGGFAMEPDDPRTDQWLLSLTGKSKPRVLFLATASGDLPGYIERFHTAFARLPCEPAHLELFRQPYTDLRALVLAQDLIYVGGGNTASLLGVWRAHGLEPHLREAWQNGTVLCGVSAGGLCWFESGVTDSFGTTLQPLHNALGFLPGSFCPHYDAEEQRRPTYQRLVSDGVLPPGHAADNNAAILFEETSVADVFTTKPTARAYRVDQRGETGIGPGQG